MLRSRRPAPGKGIIPMNSPSRSGIALLIILVVLLSRQTSIEQQQPPSPQNPDVVRTNVDLVQTAVTVIDKQGKFVDGLTRDQFQLLVDGKPRPIIFFEGMAVGVFRGGGNFQRKFPVEGSANPVAPV